MLSGYRSRPGQGIELAARVGELEGQLPGEFERDSTLGSFSECPRHVWVGALSSLAALTLMLPLERRGYGAALRG